MVERTHPVNPNQSPSTAVTIVAATVGLLSLASGLWGLLRATGGLREEAGKLARTANAGQGEARAVDRVRSSSAPRSNGLIAGKRLVQAARAVGHVFWLSRAHKPRIAKSEVPRKLQKASGGKGVKEKVEILILPLPVPPRPSLGA